jgi:uncharacterized membrane protein YoaK (UPF0700 family)
VASSRRAQRFCGMEHERDRAVGYVSRLVSGLVASAVVATTLRAEVAALAILATVMLLVLAMTWLMLRDRGLRP